VTCDLSVRAWKEVIIIIINNSVVLVRERTIPTERDGSLRPHSRISRPEPRLFHPSSSSVVLTRLEWTPLQTHYSENLVAPEIEPGPLDL
jgi:hypothetical protein